MKKAIMFLAVVLVACFVMSLPAYAAICVNVNDGVVSLGWNANPESDIQGYNLYRNIDAGPFEKLNQSIIVGLSYVDEDIPIGEVNLKYTLTAVDMCGNESAQSAPSEEVRSDTIAPAPPGEAPRVSAGQL